MSSRPAPSNGGAARRLAYPARGRAGRRRGGRAWGRVLCAGQICRFQRRRWLRGSTGPLRDRGPRRGRRACASACRDRGLDRWRGPRNPGRRSRLAVCQSERAGRARDEPETDPTAQFAPEHGPARDFSQRRLLSGSGRLGSSFGPCSRRGAWRGCSPGLMTGHCGTRTSTRRRAVFDAKFGALLHTGFTARSWRRASRRRSGRGSFFSDGLLRGGG